MYEYPIETIAHRYLAPVGGFSSFLPRDAVGINKYALMKNTRIDPGDRVVIATESRPLFLKEQLKILPLDVGTDAHLYSPNGEVVLPRRYSEFFKVDEIIELNAAVNLINMDKFTELFLVPHMRRGF